MAERVAIVTGGALGIGKAIATACAREGARIVLCDIAALALAAAEAEIRMLGASVLSIRADVTDGAATTIQIAIAGAGHDVAVRGFAAGELRAVAHVEN